LVLYLKNTKYLGGISMHIYELSEQVVKELESAIQQEQNESRKSQYVTLLQSQKNISANLKSLGDVNTVQQNATQQAYNAEFATEQNTNTAQYTSEAQAKARQQAQAQAKAQQNIKPNDTNNKA
jgi:hypothetical protein